ncbi:MULTISPECIES: Bug family tripartite tricarboxylate transporter substrate binding protein [Achromobacter]|uniref:Tripartite tricarboxylate transporter substrate binding protein n=1 Tax=Achromobacter spanius TaxID=217203 RepID=A0ABY8GLE3_9BURK|nr:MULTISPECIES: tripartite tricarboxylate transporter substrate binding protein [Achromobacter]WAI85109.1 tripartite tricarboxylate transporter substrate binding protein [Achromobacter spanius]WEX95191.1 tripartite tricarboxylate transporter substrate binding protein [Achromobacter sp. SS2-2022]WFP05639.1 tripartite tricarboxylate transporter substrate binding protein [Achromobacter spanius]
MLRSILTPLCAAAALAVGLASAARAADYPSQPVKLITAFGAGSASDIVARLIGERLQAALGQVVIVENRPGASGQVAADLVARAQPDGYTIMLATNTTHSSNPYLYKNLRYDPIKDFTPLVQVCNFPFVLAVSAKLPIQNVQDLLAYGKANPGSLNYAYGNSTGQISAASFDKMTGLGAAAIPYKSTPQAMTDIIGGRATFMFVDLASAAAHIQAGTLKALAVSTEKRSALAPNLPSVSEALGQPGFDLAAWVGIFGPAKLPEPIAKRLANELYRIVSSDEIKLKLTQMGAEPTPAPASAFAPFVAQQQKVWGDKVKQAGIQPE